MLNGRAVPMSVRPTPDPYAIQFSPDAWRTAGVLSRDQFSRVNRLLGSLANTAGVIQNPAANTAGYSEVLLEIAGVRASYTFDHASRVLHVLELAPVANAAGGQN